MTKKEGRFGERPPNVCHVQGKEGFPLPTTESRAQTAAPCKIDLYRDGVALNAPHMGGRSSGSGSNARGEIKGWSTASRRRMREFLLTHRIKEGFDVYGVTLTVPGPNLNQADSARLWHHFQVSLKRAGGCCVWRAEVQSRGAVHWHCITGVESHLRPLTADLTQSESIDLLNWSQTVGNEIAGRSAEKGDWFNAVRIEKIWFNCLKSLGPVGNHADRMQMKGARRRAALVDPYRNDTGWKRYLNDHTTKAKQDQIGCFIGRHWGVIGRDCFESVAADSSVEMVWREYSRFLRQYQRLCTPYIKDPDALFGRRRGFTSKRGRMGRSVYFSSPLTVSKLLTWAISETV